MENIKNRPLKKRIYSLTAKNILKARRERERKINGLSGAEFDLTPFKMPYKLHFGPGTNWKKPDNHWINIDINPKWADLTVDLNNFKNLPLPDNSVDCIYASHVFEHINIFSVELVFSECARVLKPAGVLRVVLPDVVKSIKEYLQGNTEYSLFQLRRSRGISLWGKKEYTLFDCLKEDFISRNTQPELLHSKQLVHQNAWDFETLRTDLSEAGFRHVYQSGYQLSEFPVFNFEGTYKSAASQFERSLYAEAIK
ncbi:MAG: class I SAM-dependent methyltransferase [Desulfarculales bacterium]|jgi:SAM-dependent methyltransferase|nr:class I SAM-dependent methyltransferase [Desulfarculales bacterium]